MRILVGSVIVAALLVAQAALGYDLSTIDRFERALRAAHRSGNVVYFEPLVCRAGASPGAVEDTYSLLGAHFHYEIRRMDVMPYYPLPFDKTRWNLQPRYSLEVWYALDRTQPPFAERYVLGTSGGQLQIAVPTNRVYIPPSWIAVGLTSRCSERLSRYALTFYHD